mgnify:CR=1 FL=1
MRASSINDSHKRPPFTASFVSRADGVGSSISLDQDLKYHLLERPTTQIDLFLNFGRFFTLAGEEFDPSDYVLTLLGFVGMSVPGFLLALVALGALPVVAVELLQVLVGGLGDDVEVQALGDATRLSAIVRLLEPTEGQILFHGQDVATMGRKELKNAHPELPETQQTLKEDAAWARAQKN